MALFGNRSFLVKMVRDTPSGPVEEDVFDDIKTHFEKYKAAYIVGGAGVVAAGFTWALMRGTPPAPRIPTFPNAQITAGNRVAAGLFNWRPIQTLTVTTEVSQHRQGPPSWIVKGPGDVLYPSQSTAASVNGYSPSLMSKHLNGKLPSLGENKEVFERVGLNINA
jgi:hypothetical protein